MTRRWYGPLVKENMYGIGSQTLAIISGVVFAVIFPRLLRPESFGYFSLVFALANFSLFFCSLGLGPALLKLMPASMVKKEAAFYYSFFSKLQYLMTSASSILLFLSSDFIASRLFGQPELSTGIKLSCLFLFAYSMYGFYETVFTAVKRNRFRFYLNLVFQASRIVMPLALYYAYRSYLSVLAGLGLAALAGYTAGLFLKRRVKAIEPPKKPAGVFSLDYGTLKKYFIYGAVGYLGTVLLQWMDSLVVGVYINPSELGFYRIGVMWISVVWLFIPFSSNVLLALYSEKTETREKEKINTVYSYSFRYSMLISFIIITGIWLTAHYFVTLIHGAEYAPAVPVLTILSFLAVESALNAVNLPLLYGIGKIDLYTKYMLLVGVISAASSIYASRYGINGVAFAVMSIRTLAMALLTVYVLSHLKVRLEKGVLLKPIAAAIVTSLLLSPFKHYINTPASGILYALSIVLVYAALAVALKAVSPEEARKIAASLTEK